MEKLSLVMLFGEVHQVGLLNQLRDYLIIDQGLAWLQTCSWEFFPLEQLVMHSSRDETTAAATNNWTPLRPSSSLSSSRLERSVSSLQKSTR